MLILSEIPDVRVADLDKPFIPGPDQHADIEGTAKIFGKKRQDIDQHRLLFRFLLALGSRLGAVGYFFFRLLLYNIGSRRFDKRADAVADFGAVVEPKLEAGNVKKIVFIIRSEWIIPSELLDIFAVSWISDVCYDNPESLAAIRTLLSHSNNQCHLFFPSSFFLLGPAYF